MEPQNLITLINSSPKIEDVLNVQDFKHEFEGVVKTIHPDRCTLPGAAEAMQKMNEWKDIYLKGRVIKDDVLEFRTNGYWADCKSSADNFLWSVENYRLFKQLQEKADRHFLQYLPSECLLQSDGTYRYIFDKRAVPLSGLELPQEHVNWILNRLLEYSAYLATIGFSHCGLNPDSVFIVPETHGIQVLSFYHLTRVGKRIGTISAKYQNWYPTSVFNTKIATEAIDIELSKRIAAYLLGDKSGAAVKLMKTHNEDFIKFLIQAHHNPVKCIDAYRELLSKNFKKEFHLLTI